MTDQASLPPEKGSDTTLQQPTAEGGLEAAPADGGDYRDQLQSRRWGAAPLANPEADKTDPRIVVLGVTILSALTLVVIVVGYGSGFWG